MKVIILAGGYGTRISEYTDNLPKPMIPIGGKPILWHIMQHYSKFEHSDFYLALGYKAEIIKEYFLNYKSLNSNFTVNLKSGKVNSHQRSSVDWNVTLIDTGLNTMTGGRVARIKEFIGDETFMLTYGDGLANINLEDLVKFHKAHGKLVTMTAVRPAARFGELDIQDGSMVSKFEEKPQLHDGWINGGFFVIEPKFFDYIEGDSVMLERGPLEKAASDNQLMAYKHYDFWHCMDTKRDHELLQRLWDGGAPPWK